MKMFNEWLLMKTTPLYSDPMALLSTFSPFFTCSTTGRQVAAESHEAAAASASGPNTVQMYVSFSLMPASALCHFSETSTSPEGRKSKQWQQEGRDMQRRTPAGGDGMRYEVISNPYISFVHIMHIREWITSRVRISVIFTHVCVTGNSGGKATGKKKNLLIISITTLYASTCLNRTKLMFLSRFSCGVSILARGSDLKGEAGRGGRAWHACRAPTPDCFSLPSECVQTNKALEPF